MGQRRPDERFDYLSIQRRGQRHPEDHSGTARAAAHLPFIPFLPPARGLVHPSFLQILVPLLVIATDSDYREEELIP